MSLSKHAIEPLEDGEIDELSQNHHQWAREEVKVERHESFTNFRNHIAQEERESRTQSWLNYNQQQVDQTPSYRRSATSTREALQSIANSTRIVPSRPTRDAHESASAVADVYPQFFDHRTRQDCPRERNRGDESNRENNPHPNQRGYRHERRPSYSSDDSVSSRSSHHYHRRFLTPEGPRGGRRATPPGSPDPSQARHRSRSVHRPKEGKFEKIKPFEKVVPQERYHAWIDWHGMFTTSLMMSNCTEENRKLGYLICHGGTEVTKFLQTRGLADTNTCHCYQSAITALTTHFKGMWDPTVSLSRFHIMKQELKESPREFEQRLRTAARACPGTSEEVIRHQLINGLRDQEIRKEAIRQALTAEEVISRAERAADEEARKDPSPYDHGRYRIPEVAALFDRQRRGQRAPSQRTASSSRLGADFKNKPAESEGSCQNCGHVHRERGKCPAAGEECRKCRKVGHFGRKCRSQSKKSVKRVANEAFVRDDRSSSTEQKV